MTETKKRIKAHLRKVAIKTTVMVVVAVAGMLLTSLLLNLFMLGSV